MSFSGHTGVGKTSAFNHLFQTSLPICTKTSATRRVDVYSAVAKGKRLAFNAVDTPGLEDTSGIYQDACNMHALQNFRKESVGIGKHPNIILLSVKSTDNRDEGPQSAFVRNIRTLESLKLIDREERNVVIVVTHACAIPLGDWHTKTREIMKKYRSIILDELEIDVPVVFIENEFDACGLEKDDQNTGTFLPDRQVQPRNLFEAMLKLLKENGDDAAVKSLKTMLNMRLEVRFQKTKSILAKIVDTRNSDNFHLNNNERLCLGMLQGEAEAHKLAQDYFEQVRLVIKVFLDGLILPSSTKDQILLRSRLHISKINHTSVNAIAIILRSMMLPYRSKFFQIL